MWAEASLKTEFGKDPLMIAATARLPWAAKYMLRCGWADPDVSRVGASGLRLPCGAFTEAAQKQEYTGAPAPCEETARVMCLVEAAWGPKTHWFFHAGVRNAVRVVLSVAERMHRLTNASATATATTADDNADSCGHGVVVKAAAAAAAVAARSLPHLPTELWLLVLSFLRRGDFEVIASSRRVPLIKAYEETIL